ncbi:MAG: glycosyltransferase family 4 protein [Desulforegulaceae bacterium]|nr:glycosyltransferase family 4 protein [Desulforegulaceae bacterium]
MKKILVVSPFPPPYGGMAVQAEKLCVNLKKEGFIVDKAETNITLSGPFRLFESIPVVRTFLRVLIFLFKLQKKLKKTDTVFFLTGFYNFFFWITLPSIILIKIYKKKIILSARGGGAKSFFKKYRFFCRFIIKKADYIIVPSEFLKNIFLEELGIKTTIVPNIADLDQFTFLKRNKFNPKLIVTRSLEEIYGIDTIIKSFYELQKSFPEAELGIAGGGSLKKELKNLVNKLGIQDKVCFYGEVEHKKLPFIYSKYDIFVNSSKIDNLPGSILEAFASGLPVVSSNSGGIPFMVKNNYSGLLCNADDYLALTSNILKVINDPGLGTYLSANGFKELKNYTWPNIKTIILPIL